MNQNGIFLMNYENNSKISIFKLCKLLFLIILNYPYIKIFLNNLFFQKLEYIKKTK